MSVGLNTLKPNPGSTTRSVRVGRGNASGHGAFSGRGIKGQRARSGGRKHGRRRGLKQMLLQLPKSRGFQGLENKASVVNLGELGVFPTGAVVTPELLVKKGLIRDGKYVKILGNGKLANGLKLHAHAFSASAKTAIEAAGGTCTVLAVHEQPIPKRQLAKRNAKQ